MAYIPLGAALRYVEARAYAFTTFAPDAVHAEVVERLREEVYEAYGDLDARVAVPNQVYVVVVTR